MIEPLQSQSRVLTLLPYLDIPQTCSSLQRRKAASYVDDTFSLFDSEATAATFLHYLNNRHPNINFTMELEENLEIQFLDVRIKRNLNNFTTTEHRKATFTGLYTKWDSFTPRKYKINLIRTLIYASARVPPYYSRLSLI